MKFVIVEDQTMLRSLLRRMLVEDCKGEILLEAGSLADLRATQDLVRGADLLLLDIRLPDGDGLDFIEEMGRAQIATPVLLFSSSCEDYIVHRVTRACVQGFVHKDENPQVLLTAIQMVAAGGTFFSPRFTQQQRQLSKAPDSFEKRLSKREQEVLSLVGSGFPDDEVASTLGLSVHTVRTHRQNVMEKLNVHTAQELQAYALKTGFTTVDRLH